MPALRLALVCSSRFRPDEPFAGGMEAHTARLRAALEARGHSVDIFPNGHADFRASEQAQKDPSMAPEGFLAAHHAYMQALTDIRAGGYDCVHNNSLHYLPAASAPLYGAPSSQTLHSPPTPWLESALASASSRPYLISVSRHNARQWEEITPVDEVIVNGVDVDEWTQGPGGDHAVWYGRVVPEKGTHLAVRAARKAGIGMTVAGPIHDTGYFEDAVRPQLTADVAYAGHLSAAELRDAVGGAAVTVVTPCWEEPYGLVVAESLASGTPVAGFRRGALPELVDDTCGRLVAPGDTDALADAIREAATLDRDTCRQVAVERCDERRMVDGYERVFTTLAERHQVPA